jgi:hypothetical protein
MRAKTTLHQNHFVSTNLAIVSSHESRGGTAHRRGRAAVLLGVGEVTISTVLSFTTLFSGTISAPQLREEMNVV